MNFFILSLIKAAVVAFVLLTTLAYLQWAERKVLAHIQLRVGPRRVGPHGLLQPLADVVKLITKEDMLPSHVNKFFYFLAPFIAVLFALIPIAVIPFGTEINIGPIHTAMQLTDLNIGVLFILGISGLGVYGVAMAGWSSNNKYSLIGGLRSSAQMISYELPLVLSLVSIVMLTSALAGHDGYNGISGVGTVSLRGIMDFQNVWHNTGIGVLDFLFEGFTPWSWFILVQPLMLIIYYTCGLAETNRAPFDLPEAESELVAGYLTEYSGLRWAMFFLGEYGNMTIVSAVATYLFLGGFAGPGVAFLTSLGNPGWGLLGNLLAFGYFTIKV